MVIDSEKSIKLTFDSPASQRLDSWLTETLALRADDPEKGDEKEHKSTHPWTRSQIQALIRENKVLVNGRIVKSSYMLGADDTLEVFLPQDHYAPSLTPTAMPLEILFEDDWLIVLNKPAGISVHPGAGKKQPTLVEGLLHHLGEQGVFKGIHEPPYNLRPGVVHRLDKDTSGVIVFAKTHEAHRHLSQQFKNKTNKRCYWAVHDGLMPKKGLNYESYLFRDPKQRLRFASIKPEDLLNQLAGQEMPPHYRYAKTLFKLQASFAERYSYSTMMLYTGRTHQIRVHSRELRLPIVGDPLYNHIRDIPTLFSRELRDYIGGLQRQMLHARSLGFQHPELRVDLYFEAEPPADFVRLMELLQPYKDRG